MARAAERQLREFKPHELVNTAWAFATVSHRDEKPFAALANAAERRLSEFNPQSVATTAWAFATVSHRDEKLFAAFARSSSEAVEPWRELWYSHS